MNIHIDNKMDKEQKKMYANISSIMWAYIYRYEKQNNNLENCNKTNSNLHPSIYTISLHVSAFEASLKAPEVAQGEKWREILI